MSHYDYKFDRPERGKPKPKVTFRSKDHGLVLRAMLALKKRGALATDEAIFDCIRRHKGAVIRDSGARTRRKELVVLGFVEQSPINGRTESGRTCKSWRLTESGAKKAEAEFRAANQYQLEMERVA